MPEAPSPPVDKPSSRDRRAETAQAVIEVRKPRFLLRRAHALHDLHHEHSGRAVTAFIGPSGCGKSTLLRCLNRMNDLVDGARIAAGSIRIDGSTSTPGT